MRYIRGIYGLLALSALVQPGIGQKREPSKADQLLTEAEVSAGGQQKKVLLIFSASWCHPCHLLQDFLSDPVVGPTIDRYFVKLTLVHGERPEDTRYQDTPGVEEVLGSFHDQDTGLPLIVIVDSGGKVITDSVRPVYGRRTVQANVGFPSGPNAIEWFLAMLKRAAPTLKPEEINTIHDRLLRAQ